MARYRRWRQAGLSVADLPGAIWLPEVGAVTLASGDTVVDEWLALYGSRPYTTELLEAPAATNQPAWLAGAGVAGRNRIRFDGVDNVLAMLLAKGSNWAEWECGFCGELNADGSTADRLIVYAQTPAGTAREAIEEASTANTLRTQSGSGGGVAVNMAEEATATRHYSMNWTTGVQEGRINGVVSGAPGAPAALSRGDGFPFAVGAASDGTLASDMDVDAMYVMTRPLTAVERARLRAWLTGKVGYAC